MRSSIVLGSVVLIATPVFAQPTNADPAPLIAATAGRWQGELQYRDYQSNRWEGLPVKVSIVAQPDNVTTIRTAAFDDGPRVGTVYITTVSTIDTVARTQGYAAARKGRPLESGLAALSVTAAKDATHWTIVATETRQDGGGMARVRETTVRDGATMTTQKDVDPVDDGKDWLPRNRTVLTLIG